MIDKNWLRLDSFFQKGFAPLPKSDTFFSNPWIYRSCF